MHRSRLSTLLIDVPSDRASDATAFWSAALGVPASAVPGEEQFISLPGAFPGLVTAIQAVDDEHGTACQPGPLTPARSSTLPPTQRPTVHDPGVSQRIAHVWN